MSEAFAQHVLRIAVAQICRNEDIGNFETAEGHAFDLLVDVVGKFIEKIGALSRRYAEHDERTECNLLDLLQAFDKLEPNRVDWRELEGMCQLVPWQVPYTSGVPDFPVERRKRREPYGEAARNSTSNSQQEEWQQLKRSRLTEQGAEGKDLDHPAYVPSHLPPFPERHTYSRTDVDAIEREKDAKTIIDRNLEDKRRQQQALAKIRFHSEAPKESNFGDLASSAKPEASTLAADPTRPTPALPTAFQ